MKISNEKIKLDNLESRYWKLLDQLFGYKTNNIECLMDMALTVTLFYEYFLKTGLKAKFYPKCLQEILEWLNGLYGSQIILVLKSNGKFYKYTRNNILKTLRGQLVHSNEKKDKKSEILSAFILNHKEYKNVILVFAVTYNWIITPCLAYDGGNIDTSTPFSEQIDIVSGINNTKNSFQMTTIESIVINICTEFIQIGYNGTYINRKRILWNREFSDLRKDFGEELGKEVYETIKWHKDKNKKF